MHRMAHEFDFLHLDDRHVVFRAHQGTGVLGRQRGRADQPLAAHVLHRAGLPRDVHLCV